MNKDDALEKYYNFLTLLTKDNYHLALTYMTGIFPIENCKGVSGLCGVFWRIYNDFILLDGKIYWFY